MLCILIGLNYFFIDDFFIKENMENMQRKVSDFERRFDGVRDDRGPKDSLGDLRKETGAQAFIYHVDNRIESDYDPSELFRKAPGIDWPSMMSVLRTETNEEIFIRSGSGKYDNQRLVYAKLLDNDKMLILVKGLGFINEARSVFIRFLVVAIIVVYVIGFLAIYFLSRHFSKPITELKSSAERIANLEFDEPLTAKTKDEIGELTISLNKMAGELQSTIKALRYTNGQLSRELSKEKNLEKMRRRFVSDVSHELKNPISMILNYAEGLRRGIPKTEEAKESYVDVIIEEGKRMNQLTRDLLDLSSYESGTFTLKMESLDLGEVVLTAYERFEHVVKDKDILVESDVEESLEFEGDRLRLSQVMTNLFSNAMKHVETGGKVKISVSRSSGQSVIQVSNSGILIPENELDNIWKSFYQVGTDTEGNGLGLTIVKRIVELHEGSVTAFVEDGLNHFRIVL